MIFRRKTRQVAKSDMLRLKKKECVVDALKERLQTDTPYVFIVWGKEGGREMTDREKAIVMAYTGYCMLTGDKLSVFYEYVENIMGRPVYTHEMGTKVVDNIIKEKAKPDFIALCKEDNNGKNNSN